MRNIAAQQDAAHLGAVIDEDLVLELANSVLACFWPANTEGHDEEFAIAIEHAIQCFLETEGYTP